MKAIVQDRYGSADVLELRDIDPPAAGEHDVVVRVHAAGCGPDVWHVMTGLPYFARLGLGLRRPKLPIRGWDVAGTVEAVGRSVQGMAPGDEVLGVADGSFAELALARADKLVAKPARLTFEQAAATPVSGITALHALRDVADVQPGQRRARDRCRRRGGHVRRADRQGVRRAGHRRVQHEQARPGSVHRC